LIALDPATGEVRAMVGGRDFKTSPFNRALQAYRQAGSAFKPFVYAAALEAGFTPATIIDRLDDPIRTRQGDWLPEDGHLTQKSMSVRAALRLSSNRAAVRLLQQVGIDRGVDYAHALGIAEVPAVPSMALGSGDVTLQAMTAAYAAFANQGRVPRPFFIRRVEDREGHVLYKAEPSSTSAISENTAFLMASLLADVVDAGTAAQVRELGFRLPAAGKTGTTNEYRDAWFVGFTPSLAAGVWVGFDRPQTILPGGFASEVAVPLWAKFMSLSTRTDAPRWLEPPEEITTASVCRLSGQLATEGCRHVEVVNEGGGIGERSMEYSEYFVRGTEPTSYCTLHPTRGFVGALAALFGPGEKPAPPHIEDVGLPPAAAAAPAATDPPPPPRKKRSFLARLFGF
jgi:penicillin-binding protein 1A